MSIDFSAQMNYVDEDGTSGSGDDTNMLDGHSKRQPVTPSSSGRRKRSRKTAGDAIVDAMLEIAAASKMRAAAIMKNEERFSISRCIKVLDEMQGVDQRIYFLALDLFENPNAREIFISLKSEKRLLWLQGKCSFRFVIYTAFNSISTDTSASMDDFDIELDEMELVAAAAGYYYYNSITKRPQRGMSLSGNGFMTQVLEGHDDVCREMFRMDKHIFHKLCDILRQRSMLRDTSGVMIEEQLAIFLNIVGHNERNRVIQERFQHSGETISRYFNNVLKAIKSLSREFLQPPPFSTPAEILNSKRFDPFFKVYIDTCFILFYFSYCSLFFNISGKYYLVDMGYANTQGFIAPYVGVRSHLHEFIGANQLPRNAKELFNHRHSSLRNVIQRCFDVLKTRFPILKVAPQYAFHIQRDIVIAACVLHNFIRREERNDWLFSAIEGVVAEELPDDDQFDMQLACSMQEQIASASRDSIATGMWNDFINKWDEW
ncbi:hypothetical protein EZV62_014769 [Acer yangbiense]|uniref:Uncharacterized protein n=1 Tax=Acer yangbiense TaxID=1000413 RepID=A0A5C7HV80_9ROSI|nr:hypothetical protein EZV62_014769 [Acer yangbiense]